MRQVITLSIILIVILATSSFLVSYHATNNTTTKTKPIHLGVSFCGNTTTEAKLLIDKVKNYTNLLILQSGPVSKNETDCRMRRFV